MSQIRIARLARGLTQRELAEAIGVDQSVISRIETGADPGYRVTRRALAGALGVPEADLFPEHAINHAA